MTLTIYDAGTMLGLKGFAAAVAGGLGNTFGGIAGGLLLGLLEALGGGLIASEVKDVLAFVLLLFLLFFRPRGLFGRAESERSGVLRKGPEGLHDDHPTAVPRRRWPAASPRRCCRGARPAPRSSRSGSAASSPTRAPPPFSATG